MFTIYIYDVDGRKHDRYFHQWANAEAELQKDIERITRDGKAKVVEDKDYFKVDKGYQVRYVTLKDNEGRTFTLSLVDGYFEDEE